jgi:hypothetical protein
MSFLFQGQAPSIYFDQDNQRTTRIKGIETVVVSIPGFTAGASAVTLTNISVKGVAVPVTASGIPGDIVFVQPMAALGTNTSIGAPYVSAANQVTVPFLGFTTPGATATQNYLVTIIKLGQTTGLDS